MGTHCGAAPPKVSAASTVVRVLTTRAAGLGPSAIAMLVEQIRRGAGGNVNIQAPYGCYRSRSGGAAQQLTRLTCRTISHGTECFSLQASGVGMYARMA